MFSCRFFLYEDTSLRNIGQTSIFIWLIPLQIVQIISGLELFNVKVMLYENKTRTTFYALDECRHFLFSSTFSNYRIEILTSNLLRLSPPALKPLSQPKNNIFVLVFNLLLPFHFRILFYGTLITSFVLLQFLTGEGESAVCH